MIEFNYKTNSILILDADFPLCLTIIRSLHSKGFICDIASAIPKPISYFSRCYDKYYQYPDPLNASDAFVDFIVGILQQNNYALVIPATERSLVPLANSSKLDPWRHCLAISSQNSLNQVLDKSKTLTLAKRNHIPIPFSQTVTSLTELHSIAPKLDYPVVVKPGYSIPDSVNRKQLSVSYAHSSSELINFGRELLTHCPILIQQYVTGEGTGIELLAQHGEIIYAFQHQRIHELPLTGGGSCYRKSIPINPVLLAEARKLITMLDWNGVAMVEFKWDPETCKYWLMEINGRFWGSLPLAYASGADFPYMLVDLMLNKRRPKHQIYRENIYCRKLSSDIHWYEQVLRRNSDKRLVKYPSYWQLITDLLFMLHPSRHFFDVQNWRDPLPGFIDIYLLLKQYGERILELLHLNWLTYLHQSQWMLNNLHRRLKEAQSILFLCYGNINRSALAQVLANNQDINTEFHFESAGFHPIEGRSADPNMINIAAEHNVDLSVMRSKTLNEAMLRKADIIFVMERQQYIAITKKHPEFSKKVFMLGSLNDGDTIDISDPYSQDISVYRNCFLKISKAIENLYHIRSSLKKRKPL